MMPKKERKLVHTMDFVHAHNPVYDRLQALMITENLASSLPYTRTYPSVFLLEMPAERAKPSYSQVHPELGTS